MERSLGEKRSEKSSAWSQQGQLSSRADILEVDVYQHRPRLPNATVHIDVEGPEIAIAGATVEALSHLGKVPSTGGRARQAFPGEI